MTKKELLEKRAEVAGVMHKMNQAINEENRAYTPEEDAKWVELNEAYDGFTDKLERATKLEKVDADLAAVENIEPHDVDGRRGADPGGRRETADAPPVDEDRAYALQAWGLSGKRAMTDRQEEACKRLRFDPRVNQISFNLESDYRAVRSRVMAHERAVRRGEAIEQRGTDPQSTTDAAGGYTIPTGFSYELERAMLAYGGMRQVSRVVRTDSGNDLVWPMVNDTGASGSILAENTGETVLDIAFTAVTLGAYKYTSDLVKVSVELMQDSAFNMAAEIGSMLGERLGRIINNHATVGTGSSQPNGAVTAATSGKTGATGAAITTGELIDVLASLDPAYAPNATWMFNNATKYYLRKLEDTAGRMIWGELFTSDAPAMLLGHPVVVNQDMADIAIDAIAVMIGDFSKYIMRDVRGITMVRMDERYAELHQVAFVAFLRFDSNLLDAGTVPIRKLTQAAA